MEANNMAAVHEVREPKPGQSWKDICAKCHDGDIEPRFCRYYGEPNGCNSPIYGEHPDPENPAALREALEKFLDLARRGLAFVTSYRYTEEENDELEEAFANAESALAAPPRNCDVGTPKEQLERWESFCKRNRKGYYTRMGIDPCNDCELAKFGDGKCHFLWAQTPYEGDKTKGETDGSK